jgi:hypothetical protein
LALLQSGDRLKQRIITLACAREFPRVYCSLCCLLKIKKFEICDSSLAIFCQAQGVKVLDRHETNLDALNLFHQLGCLTLSASLSILIGKAIF